MTITVSLAAVASGIAGLAVVAMMAGSSRAFALLGVVSAVQAGALIAAASFQRPAIWERIPYAGLGFDLGVALLGLLSFGAALVPAIGVWLIAGVLGGGWKHGDYAWDVIAAGGAGAWCVLLVLWIVPR